MNSFVSVFFNLDSVLNLFNEAETREKSDIWDILFCVVLTHFSPKKNSEPPTSNGFYKTLVILIRQRLSSIYTANFHL